MPHKARALLQKEIEIRNLEGGELLKSLVGGGVDSFLTSIEKTLYQDANKMYRQFFPGEVMPADAFEKVRSEVRKRLESGLKGDILPKFIYCSIGFAAPGNAASDGWGAAYNLLLHIARYPVDVAAGGKFFERSFKSVQVKEVLAAMNLTGHPKLNDSVFLADWRTAKEQILPEFDALEETDLPLQQKCAHLLEYAKNGDWPTQTGPRPA